MLAGVWCTVSAMAHWGQPGTLPQAGHWTNVANPRRLSSRMTCSPRSKAPEMAASSDSLHGITPGGAAVSDGAIRGALRRSTTSTGGSGRAPTRSGSANVRTRPCAARSSVSSEGVALPRINRAPSSCARIAGVVARRRALLVAGLVLFVHDNGAQALHRREYRRAGADGDQPLTPAQRAPRVRALAIGE